VTFRKTAGNAINWQGFNEMRLFDVASNTLIASAKLPASGESGCKL
jgi:hypothetical protein